MDQDNRVAQHGKKIQPNLGRSLFLCVFLLLSACSKINSVEPFDHRQAMILLKQNYVSTITQQRIAIQLPPHSWWKTVEKPHDTLDPPLLLIPQQESEKHWTQAIQTKISGYVNTPNITPKTFSQREINAAKSACLPVKVVSLVETPSYVFYVLDKEGCTEKQAAKVFKGKDAVYFVSYTAKKDKVSVVEINKMTHAIATAILVDNPQYKPYKK